MNMEQNERIEENAESLRCRIELAYEEGEIMDCADSIARKLEVVNNLIRRLAMEDGSVKTMGYFSSKRRRIYQLQHLTSDLREALQDMIDIDLPEKEK